MTFSITDSTLCERETLSGYKEQIVILDLACLEEAVQKLVWLFESDVNEYELFFYAISCIKDQTKVLERIKVLTTSFDFDYGLDPESAVRVDSERRAIAASVFHQLVFQLMTQLASFGAYHGVFLRYDYLGRTPSGISAVFAKPPCRPNSPHKTTCMQLLTLTRISR